MGHLRNPLVNPPHCRRCGAPAGTPPFKRWAPLQALLHPTQGSCYLNHPCDHKKNKQLSRTGQKPSFSFKDASGHPPPSSVGGHHLPLLIVCQQNEQPVHAKCPSSPVPETEVVARFLSACPNLLLKTLLACCHHPGLHLQPLSLSPVGQILGISVELHIR